MALFHSIARHLLIVSLMVLTVPAHVSAADYYQEAKQYVESGETKAAVIQLKNLLRANPDHADGRLLLGEIYLGNGQFPAAIKELKRAQALNADRQRLAPLLAEALIATQDFDEALNILLHDWSPDVPKQDRRWALIGSARLGQKKLSEAENAFYQSIERAPNDLAQLGLAMVAEAYGRSEEALSHLTGIQGDSNEARRARLLRAELLRREKRLEEALSTYNQVLAEDSVNLIAMLGRATVALELQQQDIADKDIETLLNNASELPQVRILAALSAISHQHYQDANTHALMALQAMPGNPQGLLLSGIAYYHLDQFKDAEAQLRSLVADYPTHLAANRLLAASLIRQRKPDHALAVLEPLLAKGNTDPVILALAGNAYLLTGDLEAGEKLLSEVMDELPDDNSLVNQLALSQALSGRSGDALSLLDSSNADPTLKSDTVRIVALMRSGEGNQAIALLNQRIEEQPSALRYRLILGLIHQRNGDFKTAKQVFNAALEMDSDAIAPRIGLGRIGLQQKRYDDASTYFHQALRIDDEHLGALMGLAAVAEQQGDRAAMVDWLKKARRAQPNSITPVKALATYYLRDGQGERAVSEAHSFYRQDNSRVDAVLLYSELLSRQDQHRQSIDLLKLLLQDNPDNVQVAQALANTYKELGEYTKALQITEQVVAAKGPYTPAGILHAELLVISGQIDKADKLLIELWKRKELPVLSRLRAALAIEQQRYDQAQQFIDRIYPNQRDAKLLQMMIQVQVAQGGREAAETMLANHLQNYPNDPFALLRAASFAQLRGDLATAETHYQTLITIQPNNPIPWNNLAWIYQQQQDLRSLQYAREAHRLAPDSADIKDTLGWVLLSNDEEEEAVAILEQAARDLPDNAEVQFHHAQALLATNSPGKARRVLHRLAAGDSSYSEPARNLLKQLN